MDIAKEGKWLRLWQHGIVFLLACVALIARRPDAIFHAQFFAEDGHVWFADAYNLGWWFALFRTQDGYFQTLPRLVAALALLVPFSFAPLMLNLIAVALRALPANLLLSSRSRTWGGLRLRAMMAAIYLMLPNSREISAGITESQWVFALIAFLLVVASQPRSTVGRIFDLSMLLLCGLTGPFCIFLLPIAVLVLWMRGGRWHLITVVALSGTTFVQAWGLLVKDSAARHHAILGANLEWFTRILAGQVYLGALLGGSQIALRSGLPYLLFLICVTVVGTAIAICAAKSNVEMKLFLLFSVGVFAASLIVPRVYPPPGFTSWKILAAASGNRYWFLPTLAFAWSLIWCFQRPSPLLRFTSTALLIAMCVGFLRDWGYPAFKDLQFGAYAGRLEAAPTGAVVIIPENPVGWSMRLIKH